MVSETDQPFFRLNTWSASVEFSPNSRHIVLGVSERRAIVSLDGESARRLVWKSWFEMDYPVQARPVFLERDPILAGFRTVDTHQIVAFFLHPVPVTTIEHGQFLLSPQNVLHERFYGSQWTYAGGFNPAGLKWSFASHRRLHPLATFSVGFVGST